MQVTYRSLLMQAFDVVTTPRPTTGRPLSGAAAPVT
jgi:hypothetical protein